MKIIRNLAGGGVLKALATGIVLGVASGGTAHAAQVLDGPNILSIIDSPTQCQIDGNVTAQGVNDDGRGSDFDRYYIRLTNGAASAVAIGAPAAGAVTNSQVLTSARKSRATPVRTFSLIIDAVPAAGEQRWVHIVDRDPPQRNQIIGSDSKRITPAALRAAGPGFCTTAANAMATGNTAPVASAGADRTESDISGAMLTLDGSASSDADMDMLTYSWTQTSGATVMLDDSTAIMPSFTVPTQDSMLVFDLTVDDGTVTTTDSVTIDFTFIAGNTAPVADAGPDQVQDVEPGTLITLDGSASSDANGEALTYAWTQTSGTPVTLSDSTAQMPTFDAPNADTVLTFSLVVNDGIDPSPADDVTVTYTVNTAPDPDAGSDQTVTVTSGATVTLDATGSSDPEGSALTYAWSQLSGDTVALTGADTATPSFVVPEVDVITQLVFAVDVSDGSNVRRDTVTVTVEPRGSIRIEVQTAGEDGAFPFTSTIAALNATLQTANGNGVLLASDVIAGAYTVDLGDVSSAGFAITGVACDSAQATGDAASQRATITLAPGENITCTFSTVNSRAAASREIRSMLTLRNTMLLANQPELNRRLDRLRGIYGSGGQVTAGGFTIPGSQRLPVSVNLSRDSGSVKTSLSNILGTSSEPRKYDIWVEGSVSRFESANTEGNFNVLYGGLDLLVGENALIGLMGQYDVFESERSNDGRFATKGTGFMVGPYATAKVGNGIYLDGRLAWGTSDNTISPLGTYRDDFETDRYLATGSVTGEHIFENGFRIAPTLSVRHISEKQKAYTDSLNVEVLGQTVDLSTVSLAPRFSKDFKYNSDLTISSFLTAEGIYSTGDVTEGLEGDTIRGRLEGGLRFKAASGISANISGFTDGLGANDFSNTGVRLSVDYIPQ